MVYTMKDMSKFLGMQYSTMRYRVMSGALPGPKTPRGNTLVYTDQEKEEFEKAYQLYFAEKDSRNFDKHFGGNN